ncbi:hypothetical protein L1987_57894 [Smallanthus sonchifolius]|uniref:Uncharacterized protein n=1 Tax=Smallanthus sonchifolius TaxID=185202 RepID=A0ACB9DEA6_9ASTR|nr:hypothetical protein L1987_57894 [Smallanthus sonchifolius]
MAEVDINRPDDKFSPYHNLTAYIIKGKKSEGFDDMINFLCRSKIHSHLHSSHGGFLEICRLLYRIGDTPNQSTEGTDGPPWKYLCHTLLQCISQKRSGWHQVRSALASAVRSMVTGQGVNFAHLIFQGLRYNLQEGAKQQFYMYPRFLQEVFNNELKELSKPAKIYLMLGHKSNIFQSMRIVSKKFSGVNVPLLSTMMNIQSTQGPIRKSPHSESQNSDENIKRDSYIIRETSLEASLLGSGSHPGSIEQPTEPFHYLSSLNLSAEAPCQDDIPSPTTTISEVLIDLAASAPNPSSSPKKVHSRSNDRVNVERAVTTPGTSTNQEDIDNIIKTLTTTTHSEDVSFETLFTERNPRCQENEGDGDAEARPKAPSESKDSTTVDEDRLKLHNLEFTARVEMLEAEVSKLRHQVSMHEAHQCPPMTTPSLVLVGTQTDQTLCIDATKKGEIVVVEDDADSLDEWIQEKTTFQSSLFRPAFVQVHDLPDSVDEEDITED